MGIASDLAEIKEVSDTIVANKVSKFCYTDTAYENDDANGVSVYNVNNEQNIPTSSPTVMKVNDTVVTKGWRARASSITRMFMNHMLGHLSYNVNKLSDMMNSLLAKLNASLDASGGLATVNAQGKVSLLNNVVNTGDSDTPTENGTEKFTTGGAYALQQSIEGIQQSVSEKAPINHASSGTTYGKATDSLYGHAKFSKYFTREDPDPSPDTCSGIYFSGTYHTYGQSSEHMSGNLCILCPPSGNIPITYVCPEDNTFSLGVAIYDFCYEHPDGAGGTVPTKITHDAYFWNGAEGARTYSFNTVLGHIYLIHPLGVGLAGELCRK